MYKRLTNYSSTIKEEEMPAFSFKAAIFSRHSCQSMFTILPFSNMKLGMKYTFLLCLGLFYAAGAVVAATKEEDQGPLSRLAPVVAVSCPVSKCSGEFPQQALNVTLAFGEKLKLEEKYPENASWTIRREGMVVSQGQGNAFLDYTYELPGSYQVMIDDHHIHDMHDCGHHALPSEIAVLVSGKKMVFDFDHAIFSAPISAGGLSGIILQVPVQVQSYDGSAFLFEQSDIRSVGVGSSLTLIPEERSLLLSPGTHLLRYSFTGGVDRPTYVMFDFLDVNQVVQPFSVSQQIY